MADNKSWFKSLFGFRKAESVQVVTEKPAATASLEYGGTYNTLFSVSYTGEKNLGELGPLMRYRPEQQEIRARAHDAYLTNNIVQNIINRYTTWVIGKGLKLQAEPVELVLTSEGIKLDRQKFSEMCEARFNLYAGSEFCDYANKDNLGILESRAYKNTKLGGDVLVVLRYTDGFVRIQLIDGAHVKSPLNYGTEAFPQKLPNGNYIVNGVEMNSRGEHVAYYVETKNFDYERIVTTSKSTGLKTAFLVSGLEYRIDSVRSISAISTTLESLKKLERYQDAVLGSAEERAKIVYQIVHKEFSDGSSPLMQQVVQASGFGPNDNVPVTQDGVVLANKVAVTTNKSTFNMAPGSELKSLESENDLHFRDFYEVNFELICAALGMPPEVAAMKYDSNFSSARAAIKDWENTLLVERAKFAYEFLQPIYNFWLHLEILSNKIQAPGYMNAFRTDEQMILAAYRKARFVGASVPHIDPLKEVEAERRKLGTAFDDVPLTTVEQATEVVNGGESNPNIIQAAKELQQAKQLKIVSEQKAPTNKPPKKEEDKD